MPAKKPTRFLTSSAQMAQRLSRKCDKSHRHAILDCGRTAAAAYYPLPLVTVDVEEAKKSGVEGLPLDDENALRVHSGLGERIREGLLAEAATLGLPSHERPQRIALLPEPLSEDAGTLTKGLKKVVPKAVVEEHRELIESTYGS